MDGNKHALLCPICGEDITKFHTNGAMARQMLKDKEEDRDWDIDMENTYLLYTLQPGDELDFYIAEMGETYPVTCEKCKGEFWADEGVCIPERITGVPM